jgi:succinoglycan biosynthesis protein ExoA
MPVRNEADFIARSLRAVLAQDYPKLEVLIADGMSTDQTRAIIEKVAAGARFPVRIVNNPGKIVPTGMNLAMAQTKGEVIVRVDGHCEIAPNYVSRCIAHLREQGVDGVGGPIQTVGTTPLSETIAVAMSSAFGVGSSAFRIRQWREMLVDTIAFPAYTRDAIESAGPYDEELVRNQDDEYNYRLRAMGRKLLLAPDVHSRYFSRGSIRSLWRQYFQYGYWKVRVMQKHALQMKLRQFAPPALALATVGGILLMPFSRAIRWLWLLVLALYGAANASASFWVASRRGWRHLRFLPVIFATLHYAYGAGFILGMIRFVRRWRIISGNGSGDRSG